MIEDKILKSKKFVNLEKYNFSVMAEFDFIFKLHNILLYSSIIIKNTNTYYFIRFNNLL